MAPHRIKSETGTIFGRLFLCLAGWLSVLAMSAQEDAVAGDSLTVRMLEDMQRDDYVTVSLLVASPGNTIYSAPGHAALRMECPQHGVDYCYEFENFVDLDQTIDFLKGDMEAYFRRLYTTEFLDRYRQHGRGVKTYRLNLTPEQDIDVWKFLDYQADNVCHWPFDFLTNNCASMVVKAIYDNLGTDRVTYHRLDERLLGTHREVFPYIFENAPWATFLWNILMGTGFDQHLQVETRLFPVALPEVWGQTTLEDQNGDERPLLCGDGQVLVETAIEDAPPMVTPQRVLLVLLLLTLAVTLVEWRRGNTWAGRAVDVVLMTIETALGMLVSYMLLFSHQVATSWNWLAIVLSPVPLLCWMLLRQRHVYRYVLMLFTAVLVLYVVLTPVIPQMQYGGMSLLLSAFAIRIGKVLLTNNRKI